MTADYGCCVALLVLSLAVLVLWLLLAAEDTTHHQETQS